jgi:hypothetical protein
VRPRPGKILSGSILRKLSLERSSVETQVCSNLYPRW